MKQDNVVELWEGVFCSKDGERKVHVIGKPEQIIPELMKTLYWKVERWTLAEVTRIGPVRIAPSVEKSSKCQLPEPPSHTWSASWL